MENIVEKILRTKISELLGQDEIALWNDNKNIIGIDEAGRGCIAGSMYIGIVSFKPDIELIKSIGVNDSKKLSNSKRFELEEKIINNSTKSIVTKVTVDEINSGENLNTLMWNAIKLSLKEFSTDYIIFMDGKNSIPNCTFKQVVKPKFDSLSWSVAAASILAKNAQVKAMQNLHKEYPDYGFDKHNGYGTDVHYNVLRKIGLSSAHRKNWIKI
jgi:ribonuclease HII